MAPTSNPLRDAALNYAKKALKILPVHCIESGICSCGSPKCGSPGKHPRIKEWVDDATSEAEQIESWWSKWPNANIGIATGKRSGIIVVDEDPKRGGSVDDLLFDCPTQIVALTGGGGRHLYYAYPDDQTEVSNFVGGNGIDIRGDGGFVVAPPSLHASGRSYEWDRDFIGWKTKPAQLPPKALAALRKKGRKKVGGKPRGGARTSSVEAIVAEGVTEGQRNDTMARWVGRLLRKGCRGDELRSRCLADNQKHFQPALPEDEVLRVIASIEKREMAGPQQPDTSDGTVSHAGRRKTRGRRPSERPEENQDNVPQGGTPVAPAGLEDHAPTPSQPQAESLMELAEAVELFHTPSQEAYAILAAAGHGAAFPIHSAGFALWLSHQFYRREGKPPSPPSLDGVIRELEARALFDGPEYPVFVRVAGADKAIYIDLTHDCGETVEITGDGWRVISNPPVRFQRPEGIAALPQPSRDGALSELRPFVNLPDDDGCAVLLGWLVMALRPKGPYPILVLQGQQGSAKSTLSRIVRRIVDPSIAPLRSLPRTEQDLMIGARASWVSMFDNVSVLPADLSDALCRLATGSGFATRKLYSDQDQVFLVAERPIVLNGIGELAVRHDLRDRAVILNLPPVPDGERRDEETFWREFEEALPRILGALYRAASMALHNIAKVQLVTPPRLVDFARWATAAEPALGVHPGEFLAAYQRNQQTATELVIESDPVAEAVRELAAAGPWQGTVTSLLEHLSRRPPFSTMGTRWPNTVMRLTNWIHRTQPLLRAVGVVVEFGRAGTRDRSRLITIHLGPEQSVQTVQSVRMDAADAPDGHSRDLDSREDGTDANMAGDGPGADV